MFTPKQIKKIVIEGKILWEKEYAILEADATAAKKTIEERLIEKKLISEDLLYVTAAQVLKMPFVDLRDLDIPEAALRRIPEELATAHSIIAFKEEGGALHIATTRPWDLTIQEMIEREVAMPVVVSLTSPTGIRDALRRYRGDLTEEVHGLTHADNEEGLEENVTEPPIIRIVDTIIEYGIRDGASDIHIEPSDHDLVVRFRIDGILRQVMTLPKSVQAGLTARMKVLTKLKIDEHRLPQDGRFKREQNKDKFSFRVSIIPVFDGEKIVIRILRETGQILSLDQIGLSATAIPIVERSIKKPHGMVLVTGPTGSGKTTTLYTILSMLNQPSVNILTIEDPIEYRMPGVNQTQVSPKIGFTFASGLRAFLRQDPNIIMVGEIRDTETAEIAIHAALTGHLVLSTLHTNDAVTTIARLIDMGVPPFLLASTLVLIIAQRLVRKICPDCITSYSLDEKAVAQLEEQFPMEQILAVMERGGAVAKGKKSALQSVLFYRGTGCAKCGKRGYKGRVGLYELLEISPAMAELILRKPTRKELEEQAAKDGMTTLTQDGFVKATKGVTTIEEIIRVTQE